VALAERFGDRRRLRHLFEGLRTRTVPPPREQFGAFGDSYIVAPARIDGPECIFIGDGVLIHEGVWLSVARSHADIVPHLEIRDRVVFGRFCQVSCVGSIVIEEDVGVSDQVQIGDTFHEYADPTVPSRKQPMSRPEPVRIGAGALLGFGSIVLPGVTVGERAYVVEGTVVTKDVPAGGIISGNPGRLIGTIEGMRA
jgi:serine acetyltransferase